MWEPHRQCPGFQVMRQWAGHEWGPSPACLGLPSRCGTRYLCPTWHGPTAHLWHLPKRDLPVWVGEAQCWLPSWAEPQGHCAAAA